MAKKKTNANAKAMQRNKMKQRRTLAFVRMLRYGVNNFSRNAWLTVAATAVMSVTLLIIFVTVAAQRILVDTTETITQKANISIYLKGSVSEKTVNELTDKIKKLDNVTGVTYISAEQARHEQAQRYKDNVEALEAIREASNELPATLQVSVKDLNNYSSLKHFVGSDETYLANKDQRRQPSFTGDRRQAIETIGGWVRVASIGGSIATVVFVLISSLVVFNTIRMAIFNRKSEIQMMKLIGAERSFIRGPFVVEAIMYGFIAAVIATAGGYGLLAFAKEPMRKWLPIDTLLQDLTPYVGLVLLAMIIIGGLIGTVSSWIATHKYLKI